MGTTSDGNDYSYRQTIDNDYGASAQAKGNIQGLFFAGLLLCGALVAGLSTGFSGMQSFAGDGIPGADLLIAGGLAGLAILGRQAASKGMLWAYQQVGRLFVLISVVCGVRLFMSSATPFSPNEHAAALVLQCLVFAFCLGASQSGGLALKTYARKKQK